MNKKILFCTEAWAGSGHYMAALALQQALEEIGGDQVNGKIVGGLKMASPFLESVSDWTYRNSLRYVPFLWQRVYEGERFWSNTVRKPLSALLSHNLLHRLIEREQPDVIVATHAYCLSALGRARQRASKPFRLVGVFTDYQINRFWVDPAVDVYVVPHESIKQELCSRFGVPEHSVHAWGIPVRPSFAKSADKRKEEWRQQLGLASSTYTIVLSSGGGGWHDYTSVLHHLLEIPHPLQLVVITGRNERNRQRLLPFAQQKKGIHSLQVLGYVEEMWAWVGAADVLLTKAGGLSCSEALAMGTSLILYRPLPGQEQRNTKFLTLHGVADAVHSAADCARLVERLQQDRDGWNERQERIRQFRKPDAAHRIARFLLDLI